MNTSADSGSGWANLPKHLLDMVLEKLNLFSDYALFNAVCVPWHSVAVENRNNFAKKIDHQLPMLLFPKKHEAEEWELKILYDVSTKKFMNLEVRVPFYTRYGGSSKGWLIIVGNDYLVTLINLVSPRAVIKLPPIIGSEVMADYTLHIHKAILSADPAIEPNDYAVVAIYGDQGQLAFIKPGRKDARWTYINKIKTVFDDILYYEGRLHAVDFSSKVFSFDDKTLKVSSVPRELSQTPYHLDGKSYIVESKRGDLLLVYRQFNFSFGNGNTDDDNDDNRDDAPPKFRITDDFFVYKWNPKGPNWDKLKSLDGVSLFIGDNMSTSVVASQFPGCSPNSIYFTHDLDDVLFYGDCGPIDTGVFNVESSEFSQHYVTDEELCLAMILQPHIWFLPNFLHAEPLSPTTEPGITKVQNELHQLNLDPRSLDEKFGRPHLSRSISSE